MERRPELTIIAGPNVFENLNFIDGIPEYGRTVALHIEKGHIHRVEDNPPQWFKEQFAEAFNSLEEV